MSTTIMKVFILCVLLFLTSSCSGARLRQTQEAFEQSSFEHAAFLGKNRLYVFEETIALVPLAEQSSDRISYLFLEELSSYSYRFTSLTRARNLALLVRDDCLEKLNQQTQFQDAIANYPFQDKDINITIRFYQSHEGQELLHKPYVALLSIDNGMIRYYTYDVELGCQLIKEESV